MEKPSSMGMRSLRQHRLLFFSSSSLPYKPRPITSSSSDSDSSEDLHLPPPVSTTKPTIPFTLTQQDLARINHLIPRLCASNHLSTAVDLAATALLLGNPIPQSLPLSALIDSLSSQPDIAHAMSLLTRLKYAPTAHPYLRSITTTLVVSYFRRRNPRGALEVYNWITKPASPCPPDSEVYRILAHGFFRSGMLLEGLRVLRVMVAAGFAVRSDLRKRVYNGLLRDAMIGEAQELGEAFSGVADDGRGEDLNKVSKLLDHIIANWIQ